MKYLNEEGLKYFNKLELDRVRKHVLFINNQTDFDNWINSKDFHYLVVINPFETNYICNKAINLKNKTNYLRGITKDDESVTIKFNFVEYGFTTENSENISIENIKVITDNATCFYKCNNLLNCTAEANSYLSDSAKVQEYENVLSEIGIKEDKYYYKYNCCFKECNKLTNCKVESGRKYTICFYKCNFLEKCNVAVYENRCFVECRNLNKCRCEKSNAGDNIAPFFTCDFVNNCYTDSSNKDVDSFGNCDAVVGCDGKHKTSKYVFANCARMIGNAYQSAKAYWYCSLDPIYFAIDNEALYYHNRVYRRDSKETGNNKYYPSSDNKGNFTFLNNK